MCFAGERTQKAGSGRAALFFCKVFQESSAIRVTATKMAWILYQVG